MNKGKYVFSQIASYIPRFQFDRIVEKYRGLTELLTHPNDRLVSLLSNQNVKDQQLSINF